MKVATWNVNSIRARKERLLAWLESRRPDIVCLQETKVTDDVFPEEDLKAVGYGAVFHGQKTYNGVAILSREPALDIHRGFADGEDDPQARVIAATVQGLRVVSVYVPNGKAVGTDAYDYKLRWLGRLRAYLDRTCGAIDKVVVCGDFNVAPEDRDVHDPVRWEGSILCSEPERKALREVVSWGLTDVFRQHHEDAGLFSWWDYRQLGFAKNRGLRIDMIYASAAMSQRCADAIIDRDERKGKGPSDHAPVIATFS